MYVTAILCMGRTCAVCLLQQFATAIVDMGNWVAKERTGGRVHAPSGGVFQTSLLGKRNLAIRDLLQSSKVGTCCYRMVIGWALQLRL